MRTLTPATFKIKLTLGTNAIMLSLFLGILWLITRSVAPLPQIGFAQDLGVMLDAGWRFLQGQMPHRDYISALGPAYAVLAGLPLIIGGATYASYLFLPLWIAAIFGFMCLLGTADRLPPAASLIYSIVVAAVAGGTYHIGWSPDALTFATFFNRQGWAALMIVALLFFLPEKAAALGFRIMSGIIGGCLLAFLLFYKTNFFLAGAMLFGAALALRTLNIRSIVCVVTLSSFCLLSIVFLSLISWDVPGMLRDLSYAAESRRVGFLGSKHWNPVGRLMSNLLELLLCAAVCIHLLSKRALKDALILLLLAGGGYALMNTNSSATGAGIPLLFSGLIVIASLNDGRGLAEKPDRGGVAMVLWGIALSVGLSNLFVPQVISWSVWSGLKTGVIDKNFSGFGSRVPPLEGLYIGDFNSWGNQYVALVEEGVELIKANVPQDKTLYYIDFTNVFNYAAQARSPRNTFLWHDEFGSMARSPGGHPDPSILFADVDFVMIPKKPFGPDGIQIWLELYGQYLSAHYVPRTETPNFMLFVSRRMNRF